MMCLHGVSPVTKEAGATVVGINLKLCNPRGHRMWPGLRGPHWDCQVLGADTEWTLSLT